MAACHATALLYDRMGAFLTPAKKDMLGILGTLEKGTEGLGHVRSVQDAIRHDVDRGLTFAQTRNRAGLSFNVLWLCRALRFILFLLQNMSPDHPTLASKETKDAAREAYGRSIRPFHGMLLSGVFGTMMGQVPPRRKLVASLGEGRSEEQVYAEMVAFVRTAEPLVDALHGFLLRHGLDDPWKA